MTVIQMSDRELAQLRIMIESADGRLTVDAAATLMNLDRRQLFRLRQVVAIRNVLNLKLRPYTA
jgi:hypothetical protein